MFRSSTADILTVDTELCDWYALQVKNRLTLNVADTLRRLYWDTALSYRDPVLRMLRDVVGMDQVLFGSDFPYLRRDLAVNCVERLEQTAELTENERTRVMSANAIKLFPRFGR